MTWTRCDACSAQAHVFVSSAHDWAMCSHHFNKHEKALREFYGDFNVTDERHLLVEGEAKRQEEGVS